VRKTQRAIIGFTGGPHRRCIRRFSKEFRLRPKMGHRRRDRCLARGVRTVLARCKAREKKDARLGRDARSPSLRYLMMKRPKLTRSSPFYRCESLPWSHDPFEGAGGDSMSKSFR